MKKFQSSRGWRNNNPMNIRRTRTEWQGLVAKQNRTDKAFCQFLTRAWGYRAAFRVLKSYYKFFSQQGQPCSIANIIGRWAPASENDTERYIDRVCRIIGGRSGYPEASDSEIFDGSTRSDALHYAWLMAAMTCVECGCQPDDVDYGAICTGIILAGGPVCNESDARL